MITELNKDNFKTEVLDSKGLVVVDFWSTNCGPCKMYSQIIDWVANENESTKICKLNVDDAAELAKKYQIEAVPATLFFKDGEVKERLTGMQPKCRVNATIAEYK